ncbi:deoxyguanosinetriphosphate triphosphohydrolase [Intrasporangium sp. YIM S08009]|uniref:deoxyguanosinetriphosphate triphosphohydrolase n=1 Tax=Intrasporangium zincisolvens TaxID=3080018 RepID=UPI002B0557C1|nr:deoxyguanosinetriphosphate triphosphohydrolase [Intrasporangium sp. YIM S08009]
MGYTGRDRERWVAEDPAQRRADRADFARDRARVLHSAGLRRLAAKTQVLAPAHDDFVRNRLTHSLEVAQIGREFGAALGCDADVVDTACLSHDLGHPPFGHNGESVLDEIASDIGGFEGNAQTLRLLTRLEAKRAHPDGTPAGLNLTRASLDATTKYPWLRGDGPEPTTKFGVYASDLPVFEWIRDGAEPRRRCLEAEVMDWSDDVAYSVHDVEDAVASGWLDPRVLRSDDTAGVLDVAGRTYAPDLGADVLGAALERLLAADAVPPAFDGSRADLARLKDMTSRLIGHFVLVVELATRERHGPGPLCRFEADLVVPDELRAECSVLKAIANHFVMTTDVRLAAMAEQRDVLRELVAAYASAPEERLDVSFRADHADAGDDASRLRVIVDQVASLTDVRALALHRQWCR